MTSLKANSFLAVSDVHLEQVLFNMTELGKDLFDKYEEAVNKAIELSVAYFISVGDLFDTNKPTASTIDFVSSLNRKLVRNKVIPLAISGDHSKTLDGKNWEQICGFNTINDELTFIGIDYNDNPAIVKKLLLEQVEIKKSGIEFIFLHGQVPELFGFVEDKKKLDINWEELAKQCPKLKGIICGDIHSGISKFLAGGQFLGYCGSLGVTRLDEISDKRYIYYDGIELKFIPHQLTRQFFEFNLTEESLKELEKNKIAFVAKEIKELQDSFKLTGKKPIYIIRYHKKLYNKITELSFLYDHAIVRNTLLSEDSKVDVNINIRSELSTAANLMEVFELSLKESNTYTPEIYELGVKLLDSLINNETKNILNELRKNFI